MIWVNNDRRELRKASTELTFSEVELPRPRTLQGTLVESSTLNVIKERPEKEPLICRTETKQDCQVKSSNEKGTCKQDICSPLMQGREEGAMDVSDTHI